MFDVRAHRQDLMLIHIDFLNHQYGHEKTYYCDKYKAGLCHFEVQNGNKECKKAESKQLTFQDNYCDMDYSVVYLRDLKSTGYH